MESEWQELTLADVSSDVSYGYTESATDERIGPRFLRITDIQDGTVDWSTVPYCPISESNIEKYKLEYGDIVVARTGNSTGENYIFESDEKAIFASYLIRFRITPEKAVPHFVWYSMRSSHWWAFINGSKTGSAQPGANAKVMGRFPLRLPPLSEQRAIAYILGSLDDKIELNRQMNQTLEKMAQAIFKSWFIDFDPVRAKAEGRDTGLPKEIADLFPDSFEDSELGEIPKGWEVRQASEVADVAIGKTPPRKEHKWFSKSSGDIRWVSIRDMGKSGVFVNETSEYLTEDAVTKFNIRLIPNDTVLLSFKLTLGRVAITVGEMLTNEAIAHFKVLAAQRISSHYLYCYLRCFNYNLLGSTSSIATAVNSKIIKVMPILIPEDGLLNEFDSRAYSIFDQIKDNTFEIMTLSRIRDTLLPKLISGELPIPAVKKLLEGIK